MQELIQYYKINKYPPHTVKDVADRFDLDYFQVIEIFKEKGVTPNTIKVKSRTISQYLVDYYHLLDCSLLDVAIAFNYDNAANVHRITKKNPLYKAHRKKKLSGRRSELVDFIWKPDVRAYQNYLEIKKNYSDRKSWIGVNQAIADYIESGEIPTVSYNFVRDIDTTTLSLKPETDEKLAHYSRFFGVSRNQTVNSAFRTLSDKS
jgi:hypothetical protein